MAVKGQLEKKIQNLGFQFPNQLKHEPSSSAAQFQNSHSTEVTPILQVALPLLPEPSGLSRLSTHFRWTEHFVFHFVQSRSIPHKQENTETTLAGPGNLWCNNWSFFPPQGNVCLTAVLQRDTTHCSYPSQGNLYSLSPQALSAAHAGNKYQNPHLKHREGIFKRENVAVAWRLFSFFDVTTVQSRGCSCVSKWMAKPRRWRCKEQQAGKEEQVEEWVSGTVLRDLGIIVSFFFLLQGTQVHGKFKRLKQNSVVCSSIQGLSDLLIPRINESTPGWEEHLGTEGI